jgi:hypothetical protein
MFVKSLSALLLGLLLLAPANGAFAEAKSSNGSLSEMNGHKGAVGKRVKARKNAVAVDAGRVELKAAVANAISHKPKGRVWCVPFARTVSGVDIRGNATTWWKQAAGRYARGQEPKVGAVMNFASSRSMPMGHVAVVSHVISDREVLVDQANWERNRITQDTLVVDVSAKGDWSRVKVANARGTLGRVNPVYGFIYN